MLARRLPGCWTIGQSEGVLLEEMNVPWPIRRFFDEIFTTANTAGNMGRFDGCWHRSGDIERDPCALDDDALDRTSVWALMGDDGAKGHLELPALSPETEGTLTVRWPGIAENPLFDDQMKLLDRLTRRSGLGGRIIANPVWRPLPDSMSALTGDRNGAVFTVHPLGGCPMGNTGKDGVVDDCGRVFIGDSDETHEGLVVLDGSVLPRALGANPALTISALSLRAIRSLSIIWGFRQRRDTAMRELPPRPRYRRVTDAPTRPTEIDLHERLVGDVTLLGPRDCTLELTLVSAPFPVERLTRDREKRLDILPTSRLRIFNRQQYQELIESDPTESLEARLDDIALVVANVEGTLNVFRREFSDPVTRTLRTLCAWWLNRGMRDVWQELFDPEPGKFGTNRKPWKGLVYGPALASRGGERRSLTYCLEVTRVRRSEGIVVRTGDTIEGRKRLTYSRASNPLRQLMDMTLTRFPGLSGRRPVLSLDPGYLARIGVPLVRVVSQRDTPTALGDLAALGGYLVRMLLSIHAWSFRLPDRIATAPMRRLPGRLPKVPVFEQYHIPHPDDRNVHVPAVITRYRRPSGRPVLFIHGYSASGTTFAHECLSPSAAEFLWKDGHDVWVLDMRTSPGLVTATEPWTFEEVADGDIPLAIDHIWQQTGQPVDVVAHCMGAAMFSMAVLAEDDDEHRLRTRMRERIGKVVLTQVGPGVVFTPANTFRAYSLSFLKHFLSLTRFDFRVDSHETVIGPYS
ncbi:MAG: alpha/beta fold hydrolase [Gammaproteobacteria bacterium]|nr:alpha/beta fold hydrolase [Gammaproteobacteria bacterium]